MEYTLHIDLQNMPSATSKAQEKLDDTLNGATNGNKPKSDKPKSAEKVLKAIGVVTLSKQVISVGTNQIKYNLSMVGARTGDQSAQNRINNIMNTGSMGLGILKAGFSGAVAGGAAFGVPGAVIGTITGLVSSALKEVVNANNRADQWNLEQQKLNVIEARSAERIGQLRTDRNRGN